MSNRNALITAAALLVPALAFANPVWTSDFESGDLSGWSKVQAVSDDSVQIVSDPVRQGQRALKVTVNHGDDPINSGNDRAELINMTYEPIGSDYYYKWSVLFPNDYPSHPRWQLFTQWHQQALGGTPPLEMYVAGEQMRLRAGGHEVAEQWKAPLQRGVWHDFVLHVKWSPDPNEGFIELWHNGEVALPKTPAATMLPGNLNYLKMGLYRSREIQQQGVVYFDDIVMATELEDVLGPPSTPGDPSSDPAAGQDPTGGNVTTPGANPYTPDEGQYGYDGTAAGCSSTGGVVPAALVVGMLALTLVLRRRRAAVAAARARPPRRG